MHSLPTDWSALMALVFVLGLRHGLDADHIASIDAMTRLRAAQSSAGARCVGLLFALGHGLVVLAVVLGTALASAHWQPPEWLAPVGAGMSIALLSVLGLANLHAAWHAAPGMVVATRGVRGRPFARVQAAEHAAAPVAVGMLFAASLDTLGLAALFAVTGSAAGGLGHAALLGLLFIVGMALTDGANGLWVARLITRPGRHAAVASRITAAVVAVVSLAVAALGVLRWAWPAADEWADGASLWLGLVVLVPVLLALALVGRRRSATRDGGGPAAAGGLASNDSSAA